MSLGLPGPVGTPGAAAPTGFLGQMFENGKELTGLGKDIFVSSIDKPGLSMLAKGGKAFAGLGIGFSSLMDMFRNLRRFKNSKDGGFEYDPALYSLGFAAVDGATAATSLGYFAGMGLSALNSPLAKAAGGALKFIPGKFPVIPLALFGLKQIINVTRDVAQGTATYLEPFTGWGFGNNLLHNYDQMHGSTSPVLPLWNYGFKISEKVLNMKTPNRVMDRSSIDNVDQAVDEYLVDKGIWKQQGVSTSGLKLEA